MSNWYAASMVVADSSGDPECKFRFSDEECDKIIEMASGEFQTLLMNSADGAKEGSARKTQGTSIEMNEDSMWIYEKLMNSCNAMMAGNWPMIIDGFQPIQILRYEDGGKYDMHIDLGAGDASHRKISCTVQLSAENDYEGGELSFVASGQWNNATKERGSMTIFPSYLLHKVEPVTKGVRYAMVVWFVGENPIQ